MWNDTTLIGLLIAAFGGTAVGLERQWSGHAEGPGARFAGLRTFTMLGGVSGLCGWLWNAGFTGPSVALLAGAVGITVAAYVARSREDIDGTTEVAALVVMAAGVLAGIGAVQQASGIIAIALLLLIEKTRLHALAGRIDDVGLLAGVRFAVMSLVVLPLLPVGPYGPLGGIRPRELWAIVLFISGLSFLGFLVRRLMGAGLGYVVTGLLGGLVSSTNVTLTFARMSRSDPDSEYALAYGALAANAMLCPRLFVAAAVLNPALVLVLVPYLAIPAMVTATAAVLGWGRLDKIAEPVPPLRNPLELGAALQMTALFQVVLVLVHVAERVWGQAGLFGMAALLGVTDVDALTISMARVGARTVTLDTAAAAIVVGVLSTTVLKSVLAVSIGSTRFRMIVGGVLLATATAVAAALAVLWR